MLALIHAGFRFRAACRVARPVRAAALAGVLLATLPVEGAEFRRVAPEHFQAGQSFLVTLRATPDSDTQVYAAEESVPEDWTFVLASHGGVFDPVQRKVKWGPFQNATPLERLLTYRVIPPPGWRGTVVYSGVAYFDGVALTADGDQSSSSFPGGIERDLPETYLPGREFVVRLSATPAADVSAYAVEEQVPPGWVVSGVSDGGEADAVTGKVKWGPFTETPLAARELSYTVTPPADAADAASFQGRGVFDAVLVGTTGDDGIPRALSEVHPSIPETYVPGEAFEIALNVAPTEVVRAWTLEQRVPAEWSVDFISDSGVHDPVTGKVKWGPFTDEPAFGRELSLILTPPPSADGEVDLGGVAQFDADDLTFTGVSRRFRLHEVSAATRELPDEFQGGVPVPVILVVTPRDGIEAMAIEDEPPVGWTVVPGSVTEGGIVDVRSGRVKWGPFIGTEATPRELAYEILPPVDALGVARFAGRGVYGSVSAPIGGDDTILGLIGRIHRDAPARFTPGEEFEIQLDADPSALTEAFAIEEALPPDWTFLSATEGGVFDPVTRKVKWGPFPDSTQRTLSLIAIPPATGDRTAALRGGGVFNREAVDTTGIDEAVRNSPPIAIPDSAGRNPGEVFKVSAIKLVLNDSDPDGDLPVVVAVSPFSANGAPVELEWPWIYYSPLPGPDIPDSFEYTIDDGFGGRSTATVHIVINPPPPPSQNIIRIETLPGGAKRVVFPGVPGFVYHIDVSEDLVTWTHLADRTCGPNGQFEYVDEDAPLYPTRYYRATWP